MGGRSNDHPWGCGGGGGPLLINETFQSLGVGRGTITLSTSPGWVGEENLNIEACFLVIAPRSRGGRL